jgi:hypothetical protein
MAAKVKIESKSETEFKREEAGKPAQSARSANAGSNSGYSVERHH